MEDLENVRLAPGDVVAVALPPGQRWLDLVRRIWDSEAALLPVDTRSPGPEVATLLRRARPTVVLDAAGWRRRDDGVPADPDAALIVPTSGTAGVVKLVQLDIDAVRAAVTASADVLAASEQDPWLCCLPLAHIGGLLVLLRAQVLGAPVRVHPRFDPSAVATEPGVAFVSVVPTMLIRLLEGGTDLARFRAILVGGAHLPEHVRQRAEAAGARIVETYGLTESCGGVVYDGHALPGAEVRVRDGEIQLHGTTLMRGYRSDADSTRRAFTPDGWLRSGDAGERRPDGRLRVLGRADGLIRTGGEKVWPQEVEDALRDHPKVARVAVGGRADPEWGERVVAFVVPHDPADPPTLDDLREHASSRLPRHRAPRELVLVRDLPRTRSGKIRRAGLSDGNSAGLSSMEAPRPPGASEGGR